MRRLFTPRQPGHDAHTEMPVAVAAAAPDAGATDDGPAMELLRRWLDLSELERRAFVALTRELTESSTLVETSTVDLSERFQTLATIAQTQIGQVDSIIAVANSIEVNGEALPLQTAMERVEGVLRKVIAIILDISKHAMRMVYALEEVSRDVEGAQHCVTQIQTINTQTRYLAFNAAIEANRSGDASSPFRVIAHELKELSQATDRTSKEVQDRISAITRGVSGGHEVLQEIATLDISEHITAREQLNGLIAGVIAQNRKFTEVLTTTASSSAQMAQTIGQLITGMQFQDRTKQHLEHVIAVLAVLEEATASAQKSTRTALPGRLEADVIDQIWLQRIVEGQTLGAMKQRLLARLVADSGGGDPADANANAGAGPGSGESRAESDTELF